MFLGFLYNLSVMVEATGLEPAASWSQTKHSTKLSYASIVDVSAHPIPHTMCHSENLLLIPQAVPASSDSFYIIHSNLYFVKRKIKFF